MHFDEYSLAVAIRDTGIAEGEAELKLATALVLRFGTPTPHMVAQVTLEHAADQSEPDRYVADLGAESCGVDALSLACRSYSGGAAVLSALVAFSPAAS